MIQIVLALGVLNSVVIAYNLGARHAKTRAWRAVEPEVLRMKQTVAELYDALSVHLEECTGTRP